MKNLSHLGGSGPNGDPVTFCPDVFGYVCIKYGIRSVLDVGCALGFNAVWFHNRGYDVMGVEGLPDYVKGNKLPKDRVVLHDYTEGPWVPPHEFDLCVSTEFVEHVEARFVPNFVETFKHCRFILMTHALPGQGGVHHVNETTSEAWIDVLSAAGFEHLEDETERLRATYTPDAHYGRNTLMLFRRTNA